MIDLDVYDNEVMDEVGAGDLPPEELERLVALEKVREERGV